MSADQALQDAGLYIDELQKIRILDPQTAQVSSEIRDCAQDFSESKSQHFLMKKIFALTYALYFKIIRND